jgi:hypothetical protein
VQNQAETGVDCGGTCTACPTCSDGVQNQAETGIDCGGTCTACATCSDGVQNQDETGVDCGGGSCSGCSKRFDYSNSLSNIKRFTTSDGLGNDKIRNIQYDPVQKRAFLIGNKFFVLDASDESNMRISGQVSFSCPDGRTCRNNGEASWKSLGSGGPVSQ